MSINKSSKGLARRAMAEGFTIIELIVVIAIVAVLAGIVMTSVAVYIGRAKDNAVKANVTQLAKKAFAHFSEYSNLSSLTYAEFSGYGLNRELGNSGRFLAYKELPSKPGVYWGQDASGAKGEIGLPASDDYTLSAVESCAPACTGGKTCVNKECVAQADYCGGTCANCGSYGSDDLWDGDDCGGSECCSAYSAGCYWDGSGCAGLTCSGDSMESCGGNCPGGSNDCTWGG